MPPDRTPADLAELRELERRATPFDALVISRYPHGGGRLFLDGQSGERELIADFYDETHREQYIALRTHAASLLEAAVENESLRVRVHDLKSGNDAWKLEGEKMRNEAHELHLAIAALRTDCQTLRERLAKVKAGMEKLRLTCSLTCVLKRQGKASGTLCICGADAHNAALEEMQKEMET